MSRTACCRALRIRAFRAPVCLLCCAQTEVRLCFGRSWFSSCMQILSFRYFASERFKLSIRIILVFANTTSKTSTGNSANAHQQKNAHQRAHKHVLNQRQRTRDKALTMKYLSATMTSF